MKKILFVNLERYYKKHRKEFIDKFNEISSKAGFILSKEVEIFEKGFARFCNIKYCAGVSSGTAALRLAYDIAGIEEGDEVIVPVNTFIATASPLVKIRAKVIFCDINEEDYLINTEKIERLITKKTKAIVPVHLYGQMCDMEKIHKISRKHKLKIIEDSAQAHGALYKNQSPGAWSIACCYSFYPGKNLGAFGDAGAVCSNNKKIIGKIKLLRNHGRKQKYRHIQIGDNLRIDSLQAGILNVKLKYIKQNNEDRIRIANLYLKELKGTGDIILPKVYKNRKHVFHLFVIRTKYREKLAEYLKKNKISTGVHYPIALHRQLCFKYLNYKKGDFPSAERVSKQILSLPIFPYMKKQEADYIVKKIKEFFNRGIYK